MSNKKYYLISRCDVGPNALDCDKGLVHITTKPATANMSGEVVLNGWCGTTSDISENAYGEYESLEEALKALLEIFGECREVDCNDDEDANLFYDDDVMIFRVGKYNPMNDEDLGMFVYDFMIEKIKKDTTDDEIEELAKDCLSDANCEGSTFNITKLIKWFENHRDELINENEDEDEDEDED